jgi:hypothetical protein
MRRHLFASALIFAVATGMALAPSLGRAQDLLAQDLPQPPVGFQPPPPPPPAPIKPYNPVTVTPAGSFNDASFTAFRGNLADIAKRKDRAGLAKLIVPEGFFWVQSKNMADPGKPGIDNLAKAIDLDNPNGGGWDIIASDAADPTLAELPQNKGLFCAPAPPGFDPRAFQVLFEGTDTDPTDWGYLVRNGVEARAAGQPNAAVVEKLGLYFVRVLPDSAPPTGGAPAFLHVALPDGKTGFIPLDTIVPLASDQICYAKDADSWKIAGYIGGISQ